eukprot:Plantae.Rhodophyta-Hildenbrandia_rubra.ctg2464.p1 GENE.Plantae.Rhodophyta-Hildenbrandia_rubra.ctg2464~~Plantae.Rhodophyta-Hildenbrandia_rubra.ctg2464.p1  ORF type:complete len:570 (-),score=79.59 Plantae.Rhodophyta-Hildenbrandia_rubra.ctg2464:1055-2764(-)
MSKVRDPFLLPDPESRLYEIRKSSFVLIILQTCVLCTEGFAAVLPVTFRRLYTPLSEEPSEIVEVVGFVLVAIANALLVIVGTFPRYKLESGPRGHLALKLRALRALYVYNIAGFVLITAAVVLLVVSSFNAVLTVLVNIIILTIARRQAATAISDLRCLSQEFKIAEKIISRRSKVNSLLNEKFDLEHGNGVQDWGVYIQRDGVQTSTSSLRDMALYKTTRMQYPDKFQIVDRLIVDHLTLSWIGTAVSISEQNPHGLGPYYLLLIGRDTRGSSGLKYEYRMRGMKDYWKAKDNLLDNVEQERVVHAFMAAVHVYDKLNAEAIWEILTQWIDKYLKICELWRDGAHFSEDGLKRILLIAIANIDRYVIPTLQRRHRGNAADLALLSERNKDIFVGMFFMEAIYYLADDVEDQVSLAIIAEKNASLKCRVTEKLRYIPQDQRSPEKKAAVENAIKQVISTASDHHSNFVSQLVQEGRPKIRKTIQRVGDMCLDYTIMAALVRAYGMLGLNASERDYYARAFQEKLVGETRPAEEYDVDDLRGKILAHTLSVPDQLMRRLAEGSWLGDND